MVDDIYKYEEWETATNALEIWIEDWFFLLAMVLFAIEFFVLILRGRSFLGLLGNAVASFSTLFAHLLTVMLTAFAWIGALYFAYYLTPLDLGFSWAVFGLALLLADLAYYVEHRVAHRTGIGWATHSVHHSSPEYNLSAAYRHGPMDAFFGIPFHVPLVLLGINPVIVIFAGSMVQLYQTLLHTEMVHKLPRWFEGVFNTASHHRVHHGSNPEYLDKNYGGILILWDRMFGTFEPERQEVVYGLVKPMESNNPFKVYFHGLSRLAHEVQSTPGWRKKLKVLIKPPGWSETIESQG